MRTYNQILSWKTVDVVQEFTTIQNFGRNYWGANGIRVEYFPRIHHIAAQLHSPRVHVKKWAKSQNNLQDGTSSCRCSTTSHWISRQWTGIQSNANFVSISARRWSSWDVDQKSSSILLMMADHKGDCDRAAELMMLKFGESGHQSSDPQVHHLEEDSKAKVVDNYQYTSALMVGRLKVSDLCEEYTSFHVRTGRPVMNWQNDRTHCLCQQVRWWKHLHFWPMILHKKIYCKSTKNKWKGDHNKIVWLRFALMQDSWQPLASDRNTLKNSHNLQSQWQVVSTLYQDEKLSDPKGWIRGNTKIGPLLEVITSSLQGKKGVEIRSESLNKDNSHSWVWICHGLNKMVTDLIDRVRRQLTQVVEGEQGWVLQGVLSRAIFRRPPVNGQKYFTVLSLKSGTFMPEREALPRSSSSLFVPSWFLRKLTWLQVTSMVLHGGIVAKTTSVQLTKD